jgi:formylglycine-generating enzyme required for sulfatase activity
VTRALVLALCAAGCGNSGQFLVHVDTDAPLPAGLGEPPDATRPPYLFDRLRIEVLRDGEPALESGARRDFAVDERAFRESRVSVGVRPRPGDNALEVRVRLFRGDRLSGGEPPAATTLDTRVTLPPLGARDVVDLTVRLAVDDIGTPQGPFAAERGLPGPSRVGTWPGAQVTPCEQPPQPDEVCVPGGAYFMGDPVLAGIGEGYDSDRERLVVVSPFFVDLKPRTVAEFRRKAGSGQLGMSGTFLFWDPSDLYETDAWCNITQGASPKDPDDDKGKLPVNCLSWDTAQALCKSFGKDLPTEAQYEFLASGRGAERGFPWGDDDPSCEDAVWGRGGTYHFLRYPGTCRPVDQLGGTVRSGSEGLRDRITLDGREIVDVSGNLGTWVRDVWSRQDEPYWSKSGVYYDPIADQESAQDGFMYTQRGGAWYIGQNSLRAGFRQPSRPTVADTGTGVRCARSGR